MTQIHHNSRNKDVAYQGEQKRVSRADTERGEGTSTALQTPPSSRMAPPRTTLERERKIAETISGQSANDAPSVDIRPLMANFPSGVAVITAMGLDGQPWGMTCTSICSVTLEPPTLLVCLRRGSPTLGAVLDSGAFALNLLHDSARPTAELFSSGAQDRFARVPWQLPITCEGPHLQDAAHIIADCQVIYSETVGGHIVVFGEVRRITRQSEALPLLYGLRRYARWPGGESHA